MPAHVIVMEDNKASMDLLVLLLHAYGHSVTQAEDGEKGVALAGLEKPDLILCDIHLPKMDGYAVVDALKSDSALQCIPVIAVTALAMAGDCEKLLARGFDGYISKPIDPENFIGKIDKFLPADKLSSSVVQTKHAAPKLPAIPATHKHAKILVVDDNVFNRDLMRVILEPSGYDLTVAADIHEALDHAKTGSYDLIISDLHMPEGDGFVFLDALKQDPLLNEIPFMFISSTSNNERDFRRARIAGSVCFVCRPVEPAVLLSHISACLHAQQICQPTQQENGESNGNYSDC